MTSEAPTNVAASEDQIVKHLVVDIGTEARDELLSCVPRARRGGRELCQLEDGDLLILILILVGPMINTNGMKSGLSTSESDKWE